MKTTDTSTRPAMQPRLSPIETPGSLRLKLAYRFTENMFGKIITPLKVQYARRKEYIGPYLPEPVLVSEEQSPEEAVEQAESLSM